jgi:hypothetical protein
MVRRWTSESDRWEVGLYPVLYGVRVRAGLVNPTLGYAPSLSIDYCAGADEGFTLALLAVVVHLLSSLPETVTPGQVERLFPGYQVKPIDKDPCWIELQRLVADGEPWKDLVAGDLL